MSEILLLEMNEKCAAGFKYKKGACIISKDHQLLNFELIVLKRRFELLFVLKGSLESVV